MTLSAVAQKSFSSVLLPENDAANLDQCRNGNPPEVCTGANWVNGNLGATNSHYKERDFVPYRMLFTGLSAGTNTVVIGYDRIHSGVNAIDYLGSFDYTETTANPCSGVTGVSYTCSTPAPTALAATPTEPLLASHVPPIPQTPGNFTFWGATFNTAPVFVPCGVSDETLVRCVRIVFTPLPGVTNPVLAWGGHIAWRGDWGAGQSAGGISGSPYHMRLESLNGTGGNQDRSLSADAVAGRGSLRIIKDVTTNPFGTESTVAFWFNANKAFSPLMFSLVDDNAVGCIQPPTAPGPGQVACGPGIDFKLSDSIDVYDGVANVITVSEDKNLFPVGQNWSLDHITCVESVTSLGTTISNNLAIATVTVNPEEVVVCTFYNTQFSPSAAPAIISGRVVDSFGNGIGGARLTVVDAATGQTFRAISSPFGYYTVEGMEVDNFYVMTVSHKRYTFADDTRTFSLQDDIAGVDFVANP